MKLPISILLIYAVMLSIVSCLPADEREAIVYCLELASFVISIVCVYIMCCREEWHS